MLSTPTIQMARGGSAIIIKCFIKHHPLPNHNHDFLQATCLSVEDSTGPLTVWAVYLPPKHTVKQVQQAAFYSTLGRRFIAGGILPDLLDFCHQRHSPRLRLTRSCFDLSSDRSPVLISLNLRALHQAPHHYETHSPCATQNRSPNWRRS
jgi:hypothetical protein